MAELIRAAVALLLCGLFACIAFGAEAEPVAGASGEEEVAGDVTEQPEELESTGGVTEQHEELYVFYLHGAIVEDRRVRPISERFGVYEYEAILDSLSAEGFTVLSEARPRGTDGLAYAEKIASQVDSLLDAGVPPENVSVVGFSKGGAIALHVSSLVANDDVNFVFLGTCGRLSARAFGFRVRGRILSIYEVSDELAGPCGEFLAVAADSAAFSELQLDVGGGHGAFYRPNREWLDPTVRWIRGETVGER